jgi:hypothetical protein
MYNTDPVTVNCYDTCGDLGLPWEGGCYVNFDFVDK